MTKASWRPRSIRWSCARAGRESSPWTRWCGFRKLALLEPHAPMSHAEIIHSSPSAAAGTVAIVDFTHSLRYGSLNAEVRHYACRHLLDTVGVMIAGAAGAVASRAEAMLQSVRREGPVPVPGRPRRADLLDAAFLGGTAAHGIELDDGCT